MAFKPSKKGERKFISGRAISSLCCRGQTDSTAEEAKPMERKGRLSAGWGPESTHTGAGLSRIEHCRKW